MIVHPVTGEKLDISSTTGRSVFKNYLKYFNTGGSFTNITVPNKNLTGEKLSRFLAELNEEFKTKVGSDVDPTKLKEITGIVTGKIDELKGLITNSNFVSKTELQHVKGRLDSLTRPPKTTGITEDFLNRKLQNYFTKRSAEEEFGKQLNLINSNISNLGNLYTTKEELNKYFTTEKANALRTELENSIKAKTSSPTLETSADITVGELKKKLVDTGLFEKSEESEGIAFKKDKIQKGMNEQMLNKKLEEYKLIKGKAEDDDTYTATINNDMIQRIERRLKSLEEKETDTKESKSSGIDKNLRKILIEGDILEDDEDEDDIKLGNAFQSANLEDVFTYVDERTEVGPSTLGGADPPDIRTYKDNEEKEEVPLDLLGDPLTKTKLKNTIKEINFGEEEEKTIANIIEELKELKETTGAESKVDTEIQKLKEEIAKLKKDLINITSTVKLNKIAVERINNLKKIVNSNNKAISELQKMRTVRRVDRNAATTHHRAPATAQKEPDYKQIANDIANYVIKILSDDDKNKVMLDILIRNNWGGHLMEGEIKSDKSLKGFKEEYKNYLVDNLLKKYLKKDKKLSETETTDLKKPNLPHQAIFNLIEETIDFDFSDKISKLFPGVPQLEAEKEFKSNLVEHINSITSPIHRKIESF